MLSRINIYFKSLSKCRKITALTVITAGILFPLIFVSSIFFTHDSVSAVENFGPLLYLFKILVFFSILILFTAAIDIVIQSIYRKDKRSFPSVFTWIFSFLSIVIIVTLSGIISIPQFIRHGDTPAQLILTESKKGLPGIALTFWTEKKTVNILEWGEAGGEMSSIREEQPSHKHWFELEKIKAGSFYQYSVNGERPVKFNTPPQEGKKLHFAAAGDPHFGNSHSDNTKTLQILDYINNPSNDFSMIFLLGDCADLGFSDSIWKKAMNNMATCTSTIPASYILGNHDTLFGGLHLYRDYTCQTQPENINNNCQWKRLDNGNVHFLILDLEWDIRLYTPEQEKWFLTQLESIPAEDWCIVMSHTFYFCSGYYYDGWQWYDNPDTIEKLTPLFEKYNVDLVLSGHKHHTEVLQKNGVTYLIVGSFGGLPDGERTYTSPASIWYKYGQYAFADITIDKDKAEIIYRDPSGQEVYTTQISNNQIK